MTALVVDVDVAERDVHVRLEVGPGETVALVGPNGAGKSTVLQAVAGLLGPAGAVTVAGRDVSRAPTHRRGVGLLAQEALLFPHLSVLDNVAFGPRSTGVRRSRSREIGREWLRRTGVEALADRRPRAVSGGQAQRVAVARALATDPELLLLDEPMAALDVTARPALRRVLAEVLADRATVVVTHDVVDALTLADRVVVIESGRVVESGPTRELLTRPSSVFGAQLAGLNRVVGRWDGEAVTDDGWRLVGTATERLDGGDDVTALFGPSAVSVVTAGATGALGLTVEDVEPLGDRLRVRTSGPVGDVALDVAVGDALGLDLSPDARLDVVVAATDVLVSRRRPSRPRT